MAVGPQLAAVLKRYGLQGLTTWASNALVFGYSEDQVLLELYDQPAFIARFPAIKAREKMGFDPISPEDYLNFEAISNSLGNMWGMKLSKKETDDLLSNDVSPVELEKRFDIVGLASVADTETLSELSRLYQIPQGDIMRYMMKPKETLTDLQTKFRVGELAGAALRLGYGQITQAQGERLASTGLTGEQALDRFGELARDSELFQGLSSMEGDLTQASQIEFLAGNADIAAEVEKRQEQRKGEFEQGGGFAQNKEGFAVGSAKQ